MVSGKGSAVQAKYCPNCDGSSSVEKMGKVHTNFKCNECGTRWNRNTADLYFHTKNELRLDPERFVARAFSKIKQTGKMR
jgi:hypothetical protein